jgi:nuclear pore complex protein Nup155
MKDRDTPRIDALGRASNDTETSGDTRKTHFEFRKQCYDLIHLVILALDEIASRDPDSFTGKFSMMNKRRTEAYEVINGTSDEVFLTNLYDWYLSQGWQDRILEADTDFVVTYLTRRAQDDLAHADLLWQFYVQKKQFYDAASIQFEIAQSSFFLTLDKRIEYLSRAKANISTRAPPGNGPRSWQELKQRISDYLDLANVQDDILQRLKEDTRLVGDNRLETLGKIDGPILTIQEVSVKPPIVPRLVKVLTLSEALSWLC